MTSPSRRKHPITASTSLPAETTRSAAPRDHARGDITRRAHARRALALPALPALAAWAALLALAPGAGAPARGDELLPRYYGDAGQWSNRADGPRVAAGVPLFVAPRQAPAAPFAGETRAAPQLHWRAPTLPGSVAAVRDPQVRPAGNVWQDDEVGGFSAPAPVLAPTLAAPTTSVLAPREARLQPPLDLPLENQPLPDARQPDTLPKNQPLPQQPIPPEQPMPPEQPLQPLPPRKLGNGDDAELPKPGDQPRLPPPVLPDIGGEIDLAPIRGGDPKYNDRDCGKDAQACQSARERLLRNSIRNISLDITPSYKPGASDPAGAELEREQKLGRSPARAWHDRGGQQVAHGRLTDMQNGRVLIADDNGEIARVPYRQLADDDRCFVAAWWDLPSECNLGDDPFPGRHWQPTTFTWKASALCHKPLYFEDRQLERYGHTAGPVLQPAISGAHFFLNIAFLPYNMGIHPPNECQYVLGYYRPGSCAPWLIEPIPLSLRGALYEVGAAGGVVALFP